MNKQLAKATGCDFVAGGSSALAYSCIDQVERISKLRKFMKRWGRRCEELLRKVLGNLLLENNERKDS